MEASIAAHGVVQALTLLPDGDGYRILAGHRRAAAAAVLDSGRWLDNRPVTVPDIVRADLADTAADQVAVMLVENDADQRIPLTMTDRVAGYAQLAAFDLDTGEIARRVGKSKTHVTNTLRLGGMSSVVQANADAGRLSLEDVAALAEFDDDPKAATRILQDAGSSWGMKHRMADERRKRSDAARAQELQAELAEAGVKVVARPKGWPYQCAATRPADLIDPATDKPLDPDAVKTTDGFAAFIDTRSAHRSRWWSASTRPPTAMSGPPTPTTGPRPTSRPPRPPVSTQRIPVEHAHCRAEMVATTAAPHRPPRTTP